MKTFYAAPGLDGSSFFAKDVVRLTFRLTDKFLKPIPIFDIFYFIVTRLGEQNFVHSSPFALKSLSFLDLSKVSPSSSFS